LDKFNRINKSTINTRKWILALILGGFLFTGCVKETVIINEPLITDADVYYEFFADNQGVSIDGEFINDGETFIEAVQLELRFYDSRGLIIDYEYVWVDTYFDPGESITFFLDYPYRGVYDVQLFLNRYD
jgi:hypothetical protein